MTARFLSTANCKFAAFDRTAKQEQIQAVTVGEFVSNPSVNTSFQKHFRRISAILCTVLGVYAGVAGAWVGNRDGFYTFSSILLFVFGTAFLRAAYLVWFRWSPLAVRHLVGAFFFLITLSLIWFVPDGDGLVVFPICYLVYRLVASQWARSEFAQSLPPAPREH